MILPYLDVNSAGYQSDYSILLIAYALAGLMVVMVPLIITFRFGGPKIMFWRMFGIRFRGFRVYDLDGRPYTKFFREEQIKILSPPHVVFKGKIRYVDNSNCSRQFNAPVNHYQIDNSLPMPIMRGFRDNILDPETITKAYNTDILRKLLRLGEEKKPKPPSRIPLLMTVLAIVTAILAAVYIVPRIFH